MSLLLLALTSHAQMPGAGAPPDEISQLAAMVGLSEEQEQEIRSVVGEITPKLEQLQQQAQALQIQLEEQIVPDFDESEIRNIASKLGELSGELTALSVILQAKVQSIFTAEQREQLEEQQRRQQEMYQQQMQQHIQQQMQQQMQP